MITEIIEKYGKIKHKTLFYTEVSVKTGVSYNTITCTWFNKVQGIKIQDKYQSIVLDILDRCIEYQEAEKRLAEKYFK